MMRNKWSTHELFMAKEYGKALVRHYDDAGLPYEDAMREFLRLCPWVPEAYRQTNKTALPSLRDLKPKFAATKRRRRMRQGIPKQMALDNVTKKLVAERRVITREEAIELRLQADPNIKVLQRLYVIEWDNKGRPCAKIGRTSKPDFRKSQIAYDNEFSVGVNYAMLLDVGIMSTANAEKLQDRAIANCISRGARTAHGKEYLDCSIDTGKTGLLQAVVEAKIDVKHETVNDSRRRRRK